MKKQVFPVALKCLTSCKRYFVCAALSSDDWCRENLATLFSRSFARQDKNILKKKRQKFFLLIGLVYFLFRDLVIFILFQISISLIQDEDQIVPTDGFDYIVVTSNTEAMLPLFFALKRTAKYDFYRVYISAFPTDFGFNYFRRFYSIHQGHINIHEDEWVGRFIGINHSFHDLAGLNSVVAYINLEGSWLQNLAQ